MSKYIPTIRNQISPLRPVRDSGRNDAGMPILSEIIIWIRERMENTGNYSGYAVFKKSLLDSRLHGNDTATRIYSFTHQLIHSLTFLRSDDIGYFH